MNVRRQECYGNQWLTMEQYLVDGANYYSGPLSAFVDASQNECTVPGTRARLNVEGVDAVRIEISRQQRRRVVG